MRVLVVPEVYRPTDATACGTVNDAAIWVERWLDLDDHLHVYWLLPPRDRAGYDADYVHADRDRVTLIEAEGFEHRGRGPSMLTEDGYTVAELEAVRQAIYEPGSYVDVVVDQRRSGRTVLVKWLLSEVDHWAASVRPFDVVADVHDLQVPRKYRWCDYRNAFQGDMEICRAALADGIWFNAGSDARRFEERAAGLLAEPHLESTMAEAVEIGSPIAFESFEERYADEPQWLHVAGSFWAKKNADRVFDVARRLQADHGIRTVLTSMEEIPAEYRHPSWVDAREGASRRTYRRALDRGDLAVCASDYETVARTPFEQAASGQVLLLRDAAWVYDSVPEDYPLVTDVESLDDLAVAAVSRWPEAVAANRRLVDHLRTVRSPASVGGRTYRDLRERVDAKLEGAPSAAVLDAVARALDDGGDGVTIDEVVHRTSAADHGTSSEGIPMTDVIYALRSLGYRDQANPGTPVFQPVTVRPADEAADGR